MDAEAQRFRSWVGSCGAYIQATTPRARYIIAEGIVVWRGTEDEREELLECIERNCIGVTDAEVFECGESAYDTGCPAHRLLDSQDTLDLLLAQMRHFTSLTTASLTTKLQGTRAARGLPPTG